MAYTKEILTLAVEIGDCMLRNGAENTSPQAGLHQ